jgi:hypothetical protein
MLQHFQDLLESVGAKPEERLSEVKIPVDQGDAALGGGEDGDSRVQVERSRKTSWGRPSVETSSPRIAIPGI